MEEDNSSHQHLRWNVTQRLEFIEFRLLWEGRVNRADVADRFNVTVQQASTDIGLYETQAPENISYDRNAKRFLPAASWRPKFLDANSDRQLLQLAAIANGLIDASDTWFEALPPLGMVRIPQRSVETLIIRWVLAAIRSGTQLNIEYQSVNRAESAWRLIEPHALGHDGARWHLRAYCSRNNEFRDFVLSRILDARLARPRSVDPRADHEWFDEVELILVPNPRLPEIAQKGLALEYGMTRRRLKIGTRVALAFYLIQHLNLDLELPPRRQQLILENLAEVEAACLRALEAMREALAKPG